MTDIVDRATAALEGITPYPWKEVGYGNIHPEVVGEHPPIGKVYGPNRQFVANAPALVAELVEEVERLRRIINEGLT